MSDAVGCLDDTVVVTEAGGSYGGTAWGTEDVKASTDPTAGGKTKQTDRETT